MRCDACSGKYHCIPADGPQPSRILAIAERPGQWEETNARNGYSRYGGRMCLIGPTGEEWNANYLLIAGLQRDDLRVTNVVRCGAANNRKPTEKEIRSCSERFLPEELELTQPEIVITMGGSACSLVPGIDVEVEHGIPRRGSLFGWNGWIVPMYHPALGLHETSAMTPISEDWKKLGMWLRDPSAWLWGTSNSDRPDYRLSRTVNELDRYFLDNRSPRLCSVDTESHGTEPFSIQVSIKPGTARMILVADGRLLHALAYWLTQCAWLTMHHAPADLWIREYLGIDFRYRDTMQEVYHLGDLPQGLKALGYRLFGVRMKSWEEVVGWSSREKLSEWMLDRIEAEALKPAVEYKQLKTKIKEIRKPNETERVLRRVARYMASGDSDYDPWSRIQDLRLDGGFPVKGIRNVPLKDAVEYGCRDADVGLRLALWLERRRKELEEEWSITEEDRDVPTRGFTLA